MRNGERVKNCNKTTTAMEVGEKKGERKKFSSFIHSLSLSSFYQRIVNTMKWNDERWANEVYCVCVPL